MAMKKGGLGKGLDALFAENTVEEQGQTVTLRLNDIVPNRKQPRKQFDDEALSELAASIAQHGVLQPLLVRPMTDGSYQLVAGERRWRASRLAGLTEVPVVVREMTDKEAAQLALIENLQRQDLNPMEEALGYRTLMENYGMTQDETATVVNKSRPAVANALRLLRLPEGVADLVAQGKLSAGHARAVLAFPEDKQEEVAKQAVSKQLSVRQMEQLAKTQSTPKAARVKGRQMRFSFYDEVELSLSEHLGRRVKVVEGKNGAGMLQLEFYSEQDLKEIANRLSPDE